LRVCKIFKDKWPRRAIGFFPQKTAAEATWVVLNRRKIARLLLSDETDKTPAKKDAKRYSTREQTDEEATTRQLSVTEATKQLKQPKQPNNRRGQMGH
jgi:hypothetical protein